jgi:endonuclease/exonuclease/phosphatase family metal-dependent hydrolase
MIIAVFIGTAFIFLLKDHPAFRYTIPHVDASFKAQADTLKVMSFNIHHAVGADGVLDLKRIGDVIIASGADIIGLQEVDKYWFYRSRFENQAKSLADYVNMSYAYGPNLKIGPFQYGTAILSRYPILAVNNHPLPNKINLWDLSEPRGLLETIINVNGENVHFFNTHLAVRSDLQPIQVDEIFKLTREKKKSIIVGDFNTLPDNVSVQKLSKQYADVFQTLDLTNITTFPGSSQSTTGEPAKTAKRIDYIFASRDFKVLDAQNMMTPASDHLPITAELSLR